MFRFCEFVNLFQLEIFSQQMFVAFFQGSKTKFVAKYPPKIVPYYQELRRLKFVVKLYAFYC